MQKMREEVRNKFDSLASPPGASQPTNDSGKIEFQLWLIALTIFVVSWIIQFIGHEIEGKKPSFLKDVQFLLIGPAWLMHFIYKKINLSY